MARDSLVGRTYNELDSNGMCTTGIWKLWVFCENLKTELRGVRQEIGLLTMEEAICKSCRKGFEDSVMLRQTRANQAVLDDSNYI